MGKKILFVIGVLSNGGAERVISILANEMCNKGYEVSILTIYDNKNDYINNEQIHVYSIKHTSSNPITRGIKIIKESRKLFVEIKPDVIISFVAKVNIYSIIANSFLANKIIVSERNDPYQNPENKYIRKARDFLYKFVNGIVFQTNDAKEYFSYSIQEKGIIITNPVKSGLPYWKEDNLNKTIITACRLTKQKNLPMLLNAFSQVLQRFPKYKLKIFGIGDLKEELLKQVKKLGIIDRVEFPGFSNNIHEEMSNASLFVIPSNYEGISNSMIEALAIGVPVISTDSPIGGARMFIQNYQNGILIKVGDKNGLINSIEEVISNKNLSKKLSKESRVIRQQLSNERIVTQWLRYIEDVFQIE